jgi:hypothetical protein
MARLVVVTGGGVSSENIL